MNTKTKQYIERVKKSKDDIIFILMEEGYGTQYSKKNNVSKSPYYINYFNINTNVFNIREEKV
tara:strand:+ start:403 stop:591 length:189 start_codon:yes stop_codon:yes gene_type:complete